MYDAIIVGARCAGASTAMLLARRGLDVLLVDRARLPSEIPHGHYIHRHGPRRLRDWGLLDRVLATGCPPVTALTTAFEDPPLTGRDLLADAIADVVAGTRPEEEALAGYERSRNEATLGDYHENLQHARLGPPPAELLERRAAIRGDEERIRDFYYASEGLAPVA
jgi:choline dehydrogenase-like flavoprotein